jgi:hypothetical protein
LEGRPTFAAVKRLAASTVATAAFTGFTSSCGKVSISMYFLVCCAACSMEVFQKIRLDRSSLFDAMRFAKLFDVLIRADKRLSGHLRDLASESLDGFDCRVIPAIAPSMRVSVACALCSAMIFLRPKTCCLRWRS